MAGNVVSVERVIKAPPEAVFDLLADPAKHPAIDGSGSVKATTGDTPTRVSQGSVFGMSMKRGISYKMHNEVIEFEDNRRIAWQTGPGGLAKSFVGGRIWRYVLEPVDGGTKVTESWDISKDHQRSLFRLMPMMAKQTADAMNKTLERIATAVEK
jgi:uncharacterized protein YndB with AHSA1/START domain